MKKKLALLIIGLITLSNVHSADLMDIYQEALENDPIFKQAYSTYMASSEALPQARAALFPQLTIYSTVGRNVENVTASVVQNTPATQIATTYNSDNWQVSASQALFNYKAWAAVQKAKASVKAAQATFNDAAQDLILRITDAYFKALLARDSLNFVVAKKKANKRQLEQAKQRFKVGLDPITSVYEAQAAYDQSVAEEINAKNNQINQHENLRKLTNHVYEYLAPLRKSEVPLISPEPNKVDEWISTGLRQNYKLFAAKYNLESSRDNIKSLSAGNWPTFAVQANGSQTNNSGGNSSFFVPTHQATANLSINMNFPMFQGGLVESQVRQAQFDFQTSTQKLEQIYRDVMVNSRIAFNTIVDGISKVKADRQTIISRLNSLESTEAQFQIGTRTMVDVTNAQQRLYESQEQLATDQYKFIQAILNLKYLAGTLTVTDLEEINSWLATTRIDRFPPQPRQRKKNK